MSIRSVHAMLAILALMTSAWGLLSGADAFTDLDRQKLLDAIEQVKRETAAHHGTGMPTAQNVLESVSGDEQQRLLAGIAAATSAQARGADRVTDIRAQLEALTTATLGTDIIEQARTAAGGLIGRHDPAAGQTFDTGPMGTLWIFWATDAPGTELLPAQIAQAQKTYPALKVYDQHLMRLSDWQAMLKSLSQLKDLLSANDPSVADDAEIVRKQQLRELAVPRYLAATIMAETRRDGGYLIVEDVRPALSWNVTEIPSCVFNSPRGIVHRCRGINPQRELDAWIAQCLTWEIENDATLLAREKTLGGKQ